jgi:hypothetical protein
MIVAEDVEDPTGRVLLTRGVTLGDRDLKRLRTWGVGFVEIAGAPEVPGASAGSDELPEAIADGVRDRFRHVDLQHPLASALLDRALERARGDLSQ